MAGSNDFVPWAVGGGANVLTPAAYLALAERVLGAQTGTAVSANFNTAVRQSTFIASALAQWLANNGVNANDDGVLANMTNNLNGQIRGAVVSSIAALRNRLKTGSPSCFVLGYYAAGDGGGGEYRYDPTDVVSPDNGGTIIGAADGGRWKLVTFSFLTPEQFGAVGNGTTDDTTAINNCFAAVAAAVGQNTGDITQRRKYLPVLCTRTYKLTSMVTVPAGVMVACEGGIFVNALASTTTFCMAFSPGSHCFRLNIAAAGGCGVQLGSAGAYCDMIVGTVRVTGSGTVGSIVACRILGSRFEIEDIEVDGGLVGVDFGDGTTNGARLVNIDSLKSTLSAIAIRFGSNTEMVNLPNLIVDTPLNTGISGNGSRGIRVRGTVFCDDTRGATPCSTGYAIILGDVSPLSDFDFDLTVNNTASVDNVTGTAIKVSNCGQSLLKINASRGSLQSGNAHRLKNAVEYGTGNSATLTVLANIDPAITPTVGTVAGDLEFRNGNGNVNLSSDTVSIAPATSAAHAVRYDQANARYSSNTFNLSQSVVGGALAITLAAPCKIQTQGGNGLNPQTDIVANQTITIPATASLGVTSGQQTRIGIAWLYQNNTLAVINLAGGVAFDETNGLGPTAISGAANSASLLYSSSGTTASNYKVLGVVDATWTSGVGWAVTGFLWGASGSSMALSGLSTLGYGQTWQAVTRTSGVTYYNTTGKPIMAMQSGPTAGTAGSISLTVNGVVVDSTSWTVASGNYPWNLRAIIPPGASYVFSNGLTGATVELR